MVSNMLLCIVVWLFSVYQCNAVTYAIDPESCAGERSMDLAMEEVQRMTDKAWNKLNTDDALIAHAFELIFQTPTTDIESKRIVLGTFCPVRPITIHAC